MLKVHSKNGWIYVGKTGAPAEVWEEALPEIMAAISAEDLPQYERVFDKDCGWYTRASYGSKKLNEYKYWRAQAQINLRAALRLKHEEKTGRT